ncbi:MFS general substrate transporter [Sarocladium strictum]
MSQTHTGEGSSSVPATVNLDQPSAGRSDDHTDGSPGDRHMADFHQSHPSGQPIESTAQILQPARSLLQTITIMTSLCACVFVAALEVTIVSTALPTMSAHFASPSGYTWIGTAYILANTASVPTWGKISDIFGRKALLLGSCVIFFVGSLLCAILDDLRAFIAARAVQGLGAGGMQIIVNICVSDLFSQRDRGMWYGVLSLVWALASAVGPVIGGLLTTKVSWRWCFWINLPITGLAFLLLLFTLKLPSPKTPIRAGLAAIDWIGSGLVIGGTLMLLLGLYLGGVYEPWHSSTVICLLIFGGVAAALFVGNEWWFATYPVIPPRLFKTRSSLAAYLVCFCHAYAFMGVGYYLPLYSQAVLLASPLDAGIYMLPFIISISITAALTGLYIQLTGKYLPAVYTGLTLMTLGIGLMIDVGLSRSWTRLVSFQLIGGIGVGMNFEGPLLAVQAVVADRDVAAATAAMGFVRSMATAVSVVIGGVVFQNVMKTHRSTLQAELGQDIAERLSGASATASVEFLRTLSADQQLVARAVYYHSIQRMWIMYTAFSALGLFLGFLIRGHHLSTDHHVAPLGLDLDSNSAPSTTRPASGETAGVRMRRVARATHDEASGTS